MSPMLNCYPERRLLSDVMLKHSWLTSETPENYYMYASFNPGAKKNTKK